MMDFFQTSQCDCCGKDDWLLVSVRVNGVQFSICPDCKAKKRYRDLDPLQPAPAMLVFVLAAVFLFALASCLFKW